MSRNEFLGKNLSDAGVRTALDDAMSKLKVYLESKDHVKIQEIIKLQIVAYIELEDSNMPMHGDLLVALKLINNDAYEGIFIGLDLFYGEKADNYKTLASGKEFEVNLKFDNLNDDSKADDFAAVDSAQLSSDSKTAEHSQDDTVFQSEAYTDEDNKDYPIADVQGDLIEKLSSDQSYVDTQQGLINAIDLDGRVKYSVVLPALFREVNSDDGIEKCKTYLKKIAAKSTFFNTQAMMGHIQEFCDDNPENFGKMFDVLGAVQSIDS